MKTGGDRLDKNVIRSGSLCSCRAPTPWEAYTGIGNELLVIQKAFEVDAEQFSILSPGTPFIREQFVCIRCGEGALAIQRVKLGRRQMSGADFAKLLQ